MFDPATLNTIFHKWGPWAAVLMMFHAMQATLQSIQVTVAQNTTAIETLVKILPKLGGFN